MKSKLSIKIIGVTGGAPKWIENSGKCISFIDSPGNYISVDAFHGRGETYQRADACRVEVCENGRTVFGGSFAELAYLVSRQVNYPVKTLPKSYHNRLVNFPNFAGNGNVTGMKQNVYGKRALLVRCGSFIYDVSGQPELYFNP